MRTTQQDELIEAYVISKATAEAPLSALRIAQATGIPLTEVQDACRDLVGQKVLEIKIGLDKKTPCYHSRQGHAPAINETVTKVEDNPVDRRASEHDEKHVAKCGAILPSELGRKIHEGLCKKCKAGEKQPVKMKEKPKCRHCGESIDPRSIKRHEIACARKIKNRPLKERFAQAEKTAKEEVKEILGRKAETPASDPSDVEIHFEPEDQPPVKTSVEPVSPKPRQTYIITPGFSSKLIVTGDELHEQINSLFAHGIKELTITRGASP
jgi:hypothetical protein